MNQVSDRLMEMPPEQLSELRKRCLRSLFSFCVAIMGYDDISEDLHLRYCQFLEGEGQRKQVTLPRSFVKTWIGSVAYPIWVTLPRESPDEFPAGASSDDKFWKLGANMRILIVSYVIGNAEKMIGLIKKTYESNQALQMLFPEVIPVNFNKTRWSNDSACINRSDQFTESTFEAAGIGGSATSRHYDLILEDDLIYAKKDDLNQKELQPNQEDIDKAIGWHKLATSLLVPGKHTRMHNTGTRWARKDLIQYIWENEPGYKVFREACVSYEELESGKHWTECTPTWSKCYDYEQLQSIAQAQGPYMFSTQYLLRPLSLDELLFKPSWIQYYKHKSELPADMRIFTTVDLAEWEEPTRKSDCNAVVLTCGWCSRHHMWILGYDVGRFNPTEVLMKMARHWKLYSPEFIGVEAVYYQKAIAHFAREYSQMGKIPWMSIRQIHPEGNASKELRIRALEPLASNLAIHCREDHKEWLLEYSEYVPNNRSCKKDLLDATAYQLQVARPGIAQVLAPSRDYSNYKFESKMDEFLESRWKEQSGRSDRDIDPNPFRDRDLIGVSDFRHMN